ncbi:MAG: 30S ribosomal protein S20 [Candidatus Omnitrophica bacterium]|nr:30S ribosomal protein S20 [Candidatus Omnitrophota bacterium]
MPNIRSAAKRMRSDAKKRERNQAMLSELKSLSKKLAIVTDYAKAQEVAKETISKYDIAATRGIIPQGRADRRKSRVTQFVNKLQAAAKK